MRPSSLQHVVAILRTTAGLTQKELADLAGCSSPTIQSVEIGRLQLSEALAQRLADHTGVPVGWLLRNDTRQPIQDRRGRPYTRATYEQWQAQRRFRLAPTGGLAEELVDYLFLWVTFKRQLGLLATILAHAYRRKASRLCAYKCDLALEKLSAEFVRDLQEDEAARLAEQDRQTAETRTRRGLFFLSGLPEQLLGFQAEIDREFQRRMKVGPGVKALPDLRATRACLREFQAMNERYRRAAEARTEARPGKKPRAKAARRKRSGH
jgi:transcriptional regulator with XRE-family HTH domain